MENCKTIKAEELKEMANLGCIILDVRTDMEHREMQLGCNHFHVPLDILNPDDFMNKNGFDKDKAIYLLCRGGKRAATAAEKFNNAGYTNVHVIEGGILACQNCGTDIACPAKKGASIPLERQVRIAAGLFIVIGSALALTLSPVFTFIPLAVGCGLIFAGVTDRCGLALILTKAPWNTI